MTDEQITLLLEKLDRIATILEGFLSSQQTQIEAMASKPLIENTEPLSIEQQDYNARILANEYLLITQYGKETVDQWKQGIKTWETVAEPVEETKP